MEEDQCKIIEKHLKAMLFKSPDEPDRGVCPTEVPIGSDKLPLVISPDASRTISHSPYSPFQEWEFAGQQKNQLKNIARDNASEDLSSELIDRAALTNFAAQHLAEHGSGTNMMAVDDLLDRREPPPGFGGRSSELDTVAQSLPHMNQKVQTKIKDIISSLTDGNAALLPTCTDKKADSLLNDSVEGDATNQGMNDQHSSGISDVKTRKKRSKEEKSEMRENYLKRKTDIKEQKKAKKKAEKEESKKKKQLKGDKQVDSEKASGVSSEERGEKSSKAEKPGKVLKKSTVAIRFNRDLVPRNEVEFIAYQSKKNDWWIFACEVCDYNTSSDLKILAHIESSGHERSLQKKLGNRSLRFLPAPLPEQLVGINKQLSEIAQRALTKSMIRDRESVAMRINCLFNQKHSGCSVQIVGSSVNGFGMQGSEGDLILKVQPELNAADMLASLYDMLRQDKNISNVYSEFHEKIPRIIFEQNNVPVKFNVTLDNSGYAVQMTKLLSLYSSLDSRVSVLGVVLKFWAHICELDKPEKGTLPSFCFSLMVIYFLQRVEPPVLPIIEDISQYQESNSGKSAKGNDWESKNRDSVGSLWLKMFKFYCFEYQYGLDVVSVCSKKKVTCSDKNWGTKFLAIEDPFVRRNLAHIIPNRKVFEYIQNCFLNTYKYFGHPRSGAKIINAVRKRNASGSPVDESSLVNGLSTSALPSANDSSELTESVETDNMSVKDLLEDHDSDLPFDSVIATVSKLALDDVENDDNNNIDCPEDADSLNSQRTDAQSAERKEDIALESPETRHEYVWDFDGAEISLDSISYTFPSKEFRGPKSLPLVCRLCQKNGHLKNDCPEEVLPPVLQLPPMTSEFMDCINKACVTIKDQYLPTARELRDREEDKQQLLKVIKKVYPDAVLTLFGSFCNGFGFTNSDMDFCLTFEDKEAKDLNHIKIIEELANILSKNPRFTNVMPITSAKVPIVKFYDTASELESDISLYNMLAQHNTRMLDTYCKIDRRVQIIGIVLKYFAKILDICDASKGSLSSYAYILMAIFFLQQRNPPVIPVLQELHSGEKPKLMVDGWNAWFYDDLKNLPKVWSDYGKNKESVGELWQGLLSFYAHDFNMKDYVISIRQKDLLSRFRKLWNSQKIAIEDPFDLNHNLGSGLSRKMNNYIMKAFIRGREHFGTPISRKQIRVHPAIWNYLFDRRALNRGFEPPNDRGCRLCGKIGHFMAACTNYQKGSPGKQKSGMNNQSPIKPDREIKRKERRRQRIL